MALMDPRDLSGLMDLTDHLDRMDRINPKDLLDRLAL